MYKIPINTLLLGKNLLFVPECHSTNTLAMKSAVKPDFPEGSVIITDKQVAGRGQREHIWVAEPGKNLTFSMVLKPVFLDPRDYFLLNAAVSLGVWCYVNNLFVKKKVTVKWPNDVLVDGMKICGILIENQIKGTRFVTSIVGVGLNVNQNIFHGFEASSLSAIAGRHFSLSEVLDMLLVSIESYYMMLQRGKYAFIRRKYSSILFGMGEKRMFLINNQRVEGIVRGVDEEGRLKVELDSDIRLFNAKEIEWLR